MRWRSLLVCAAAMRETYRPLPPETDVLPALKIIFVGAAALALFTIASLGPWWLSHRGPTETQVPVSVGQATIGGIEQRPFSLRRRSVTRRCAVPSDCVGGGPAPRG